MLTQFQYHNKVVNALGVDTIWDNTQEQFYDGEFSGSIIDYESKVQYNPYRKVKPNSTNLEATTINVDATAGRNLGNFSPPTQFTVIGNNNLTWDATAVPTTAAVAILGITAISLIPYQNYIVSYTINITQENAATVQGEQYLQQLDKSYILSNLLHHLTLIHLLIPVIL